MNQRTFGKFQGVSSQGEAIGKFQGVFSKVKSFGKWVFSVIQTELIFFRKITIYEIVFCYMFLCIWKANKIEFQL